MAESQKYYLGDTIIYHQYLGSDLTAVSYDVEIPTPYTESLYIWLDANNLNSWTPGDDVWYDIQGNVNVGLSGSYSSGSTPAEYIDFNGTGYGTFNDSLGEFTIITWFRMDATKVGNTIVGGLSGNYNDQQAKIAFNPAGPIQSRMVYNSTSYLLDIGFETGSMLGEWHQLNVKRDANNYVSASLDTGSWAIAPGPQAGAFDLKFLANNENLGQIWDGAISNMLIYTSSISNDNVLENYNYYSQLFNP